MPWLTGTAFLHSVMMQEKRGTLKVWNVWLIFATFMLSVLGTSLTRSGVVSSVHAFAQSSIGTWFWAFLSTIIATCLFFYLKNKSHLRTEHRLESLVSRESSFLFNNLLFVLLCFTVLWEHSSHSFRMGAGQEDQRASPFFNKVAFPVTVLLLLLTAVGLLLAWRRTSLESIKRNFLWPAVGSLIVGMALVIGGYRPWREQSEFYSLMVIVLSALVIFTVISEFYRGSQPGPEPIAVVRVDE